MAVDHIRYDLLTQEALRGVLRTVLSDAAKNGLPGDHHFFVTFDTCAEGVRLSQRMRAQYPKEMTIVLQHQFWDLAVSEDAFEVGLSFGGVPERLSIPFAAVKGFFDPSVEFGLQFEQIAVRRPRTAGAKPEAAARAQEERRRAGQSAHADQAATHHPGGAGRADARQSGDSRVRRSDRKAAREADRQIRRRRRGGAARSFSQEVTRRILPAG